ncbi:MAG: hypothetical protein BWK80_27800 [Desulfobacteraceae bacterium IS3]|nr:MAG: hypothetical protein BWK80_27800 [Desulfobacteraceae bacterium IS3]
MSKIKALADQIAANPYFLIIASIASIIGTFILPLAPSEYLKTALIWFWLFVILIVIIFVLVKKAKPLILFLCLYFVLTPALWVVVRHHDWSFYKYSLDLLKTPELSHDVVLIDVSYPDRIKFRKNVGRFLEELAKLPERATAVGLDVVYRAFEQSTKESKAATDTLIKGVQAITAKGIPVIAAYNPNETSAYYDPELFGEKSPFTDIGHNIVRVRDGKFHAKISERIQSDSKIGMDLKTFFAVLMVKYGHHLGDDYPLRLEKKYDNILPIRYQKKFDFETFYFSEKKALDGKIFDGKALLVGNFEKDYKKEDEFYGLHAIGYALQMLSDQAKGKEILINFEHREGVILSMVLAFSLLEVYLCLIMSKRLEKIVSCAASILASELIFIVGVFLLTSGFNYLFADLTIVTSGIVISGLISWFYIKNHTLSEL